MARVTKLSADLTRADIKDLTDQTDIFFSFDDLNSSTMLFFVPQTLQFFICQLFSPQSKPTNVKIAAICQALLKLTKSKTIFFHLLLAFAAKMHHKSGGYEFAVQLLHIMGFGFSNEKIRKLEKSFCFHDSSPNIVDLNELWDLSLYSADNGDILQTTMDVKNTLYMMVIT